MAGQPLCQVADVRVDDVFSIRHAVLNMIGGLGFIFCQLACLDPRVNDDSEEESEDEDEHAEQEPKEAKLARTDPHATTVARSLRKARRQQ